MLRSLWMASVVVICVAMASDVDARGIRSGRRGGSSCSGGSCSVSSATNSTSAAQPAAPAADKSEVPPPPAPEASAVKPRVSAEVAQPQTAVASTNSASRSQVVRRGLFGRIR
jgi:hypothetical protein